MNEIWQALAREAGLAAEHLAIGVSALGKANYAQPAYYSQAFFALTIGIERSAKLALVVDHSLANTGSFPPQADLKGGFGHNIKQLLSRVDAIAEQRGLSKEERMPGDAIHEAIIDILSGFATNITRYYNLDLVTSSSGGMVGDDPVRTWFERVTVPVIEMHYRPHHKARHEKNAQVAAAILDELSWVRFHTETGDVLDSVYAASMHRAITDFAKPYTRMYVMQVARFLAHVFSALTAEAYRIRLEVIPHLSEFYAIFNNDDRYFRERKSWSIHGG